MDDLLSSPDPLNDNTLIFSTKVKRSSRARQSSFPISSTPKKRTFQLDVGNEISPHRIRVTVQAENSDFEDRYARTNSVPFSPSRQAGRKKEQISTRTNLKKDRFDSNGNTPQNVTPKNGLGQAKKLVTTTSTKKRGRTPKKKKKKSVPFSDLFEGDDQDDDFEVVIPTNDVGESAKRMRSSLKPANEVSPTNSLAKDSEHRTKMLSGSKARRGKNERKTTQSPSIRSRDRSTNFGSNTLRNTQKGSETFENFHRYSDTKNRAASPNINTNPHPPGSLRDQDSDIISHQINAKIGSSNTESYSNTYHIEQPNSHLVSELNKSPSPYSPSKLISQSLNFAGSQFQKDQLHESTSSRHRTNLTEEPREFDSILESEGFSLISADSIMSLKEHIKKTREKIDLSILSRTENTEHSILQDKNQEQLSRTPGSEILNITKISTDAFYPNEISAETSRAGDFALDKVSNIRRELSTDPESQHSELSSQNRIQENGSFSSITPEAFSNVPSSSKLHKAHAQNVISRLLDVNKNSSLATSTPIYQSESTDVSKIPKARSYLSSDQNQSFPDSLSSEYKKVTPEIQLSKYKFPSKKAKGFSRLSKESPNLAVSHHISSSPPSAASKGDLTYPKNDRFLELGTLIDHNRFMISPSASPSFPMLVNSRQESSRLSSSPTSDKGYLPQKAVILSSSTLKPVTSETLLTNQLVEHRSKEQSGVDLSLISTFNHNKYFSGSPSQTPKRKATQEQWQEVRKIVADRSSPLSWTQKRTVDLTQGQRYSSPRNEDVESGAISNSNHNISPTYKIAEATIERQILGNRDTDFQGPKDLNSFKATGIHSSESDGDEDFELLLETLNHASPNRQKSQITSHEPLESLNDLSAGLRHNEDLIQSKRPTNLELFNSFNSKELSEAALRNDSTPNIFNQSESRKSKEDQILDDFRAEIPQPRDSVHSALKWDHRNLPIPPPNQSSSVAPTNYYNSSLIEFSPSISSPRLNLKNGKTYADRQDRTFRSQPRATIIDPRSKVDSSLHERSTTPPNSIFGESVVNGSLPETSKPIRQMTASNQTFAKNSSSPSLSTSHHNTISSSVIETGNEEKINSNKISESTDYPADQPVSLPHALPTSSEISPIKSCLLPPKTLARDSSPDHLRTTPSKAVTFVSSSPIASSPLSHLLSSSTWTRNHWLALAKIVHHWSPRRSPSHTSLDRPRNTTRVISKLFGRKVSRPNGETMTLEQWHLEAIDEFRSAVPGWEEKGVAKRVFALVVGGQIRAARRLKRKAERRRS